MTSPAIHPAPGGLTLGQLGGVLNGSPIDEPRAGLDELHAVLGALQAEGAPIPHETGQALGLIADVAWLTRPDSLGDPAAVVARADLDTLDALTLVEAQRAGALEHARRASTLGFADAIHAALLTRAVNALAAGIPDVLAPLAEPFRAALGDVERAVAAGITADSGPADVIDDDEAVAAWRRLVAPDSGVGRCNRLWTLRCRLLRVVGCHVDPAPRPVPSPDPLADRLRAMQGKPPAPAASTAAPAGVVGGFARHGRTAWLQAGAAGHDVVAEFARPDLVPARRHDRDMRATEPIDAPTAFELEAAALLAQHGPNAGALPDTGVRVGGLEHPTGGLVDADDPTPPARSTATSQPTARVPLASSTQVRVGGRPGLADDAGHESGLPIDDLGGLR